MSGVIRKFSLATSIRWWPTLHLFELFLNTDTVCTKCEILLFPQRLCHVYAYMVQSNNDMEGQTEAKNQCEHRMS